MSSQPYLLKVLALGMVPRVLTAGMTAVSLPLMLRAVGAEEFGVLVYMAATVSVLEAFVDGGVSSAAGKAVATRRETCVGSLRSTVLAWARLQTRVAYAGFLPLLGLSYGLTSISSSVGSTVLLMSLVVLAAWLMIAVNFSRSILSALLAFRALAALDTLDSLLRSTVWLAVAALMPSALGLAIGGLVTAVCLAALGATLLWGCLRTIDSTRPSDGADAVPGGETSAAVMLRESADFLVLRVATRIFQAVPVFVFGRALGAEVVGIVAAAGKMAEIVNFPFAIVGNALAVRAPGIVAEGPVAIRALWDAVSRFVALACCVGATVYFGAEFLARILLPGSIQAGSLIAILSVTVASGAVSSLIAPMSDYVGALRRRNLLMAACALGQLPILWLGTMLGDVGAVSAYVGVSAFMTIGYWRIAIRSFFSKLTYQLPLEAIYAFGLIGVGCALAELYRMSPLVNVQFARHLFEASMQSVIVLWAVIFVGVVINTRARLFFLSRRFLNFTV